jgi:hypothetical protein
MPQSRATRTLLKEQKRVFLVLFLCPDLAEEKDKEQNIFFDLRKKS